jgi:hypothetical protein
VVAKRLREQREGLSRRCLRRPEVQATGLIGQRIEEVGLALPAAARLD